MISTIRHLLTISRRALDGGIGRSGQIRNIALLGEDRPLKRMLGKSLVWRIRRLSEQFK
jgi:hypothetical protein